MKKVIILKPLILLNFLILFMQTSFAQNTCSNAINLSQAQMYNCDTVYILNDTIVWFKFTADTTDIVLSCGTLHPTTDTTISHIKKIDVYSGASCGNLTNIFSQSYSYSDSAGFTNDILSNLTISADYYVRIENYGIYSNCSVCPGITAELNFCISRINIIAGGCPNGCPDIANGNHISNGPFNSNGLCVAGHNDPFCPTRNYYCQNCWRSAWGSPQVRWIGGTNSYAWMWCFHNSSSGFVGEAIMTRTDLYSINIQPNVTYFLSYDSQRDPAGQINFIGADLNFVLLDPTLNLNPLPLNPGFNTCTPSGSNGAVIPMITTGNLIHSRPLTGTNWQHTSACFNIPNTSNNLSLLMYPQIHINPGYTTKTFIGVDNVYINILNDPGPNQTYNCIDPVTIGPECPIVDANVTYLWSTGATTPNITVSPTTTTIYTLTVTVGGQFGCSEQQSVTVYSTCCEINISMSNTPASCNNGTATANVTGTHPPHTYLWSTGATTQSITGLTSGTYTVTVTNAIGCTSSASTFVPLNNNPPLVPIIHGNVSACAQPPNQSYSISNVLPGAQYNWTTVNSNPQGASGSGTTANVNFSDYLNGSITFTVTTANGCSSSATFDIYKCCEAGPNDPNDIDLSGWNAYDYYQQFGNINGTWTPQNNTGPYVIINTVFTVNYDFTISSSNIVLGPNAKIDVLQGYHLQIRDCWLHSCSGYMWGSISATSPTCSLTLEGSFIEDAQRSIFGASDAVLHVNNNKFNKNFISVVLNTYSQTSTKEFHSNHFICTNNIFGSPPYTVIDLIGKQPYVNRRSFRGFDLENVLNFHPNNQYVNVSTNIFFNHNYGIYGFNSDITAFNNFFDQIINDGSLKPPSHGMAIYSRSNTPAPVILSVGDNVSGQVRENEFNNVAIGINGTGNFTSTIKFNEFNNASWSSISVSENRNSHTITDNIMFDSFKGIESTNINLPPLFLIARNSYSNTSGVVGNFHNTAILVQNSVSMNSNLEISGNILDNARYGVFLRNVENTRVINNQTIAFNASPPFTFMHAGVLIERSPYTHVRNNTITCYYQTNPPFPTNQNPGATNIRGIHADNSIELRIFENIITNMGYSMSLFNNVNGSKLKCNIMNDYLEGIRFSSTSIPPQGDPGNPDVAWDNEWHLPSGGSFDRVSGTTQSGLPINWYHISGPEFIPLPCLPTTLVNALPTSTGDCSYPDGERREDYSGEAADTLNTSIPEEEYIAKEDAYKFFVENPDQLNLTEPEDVVYQSFYNTMHAGIMGEKENIVALIRDEDYINALNAVNAMTDTNLIEYNFKVVNEIYLNLLVNDSLELTESDQLILENIAYQLPLYGGNAVYQARAILGLEVMDDYSNVRLGNNLQQLFNDKQIKSTYFYPIPAKDELTIDKISGEINVQLVDLSGRIILSKTLNSNHISVKDIPSGIYFGIIIKDGIILTREIVQIVE